MNWLRATGLCAITRANSTEEKIMKLSIQHLFTAALVAGAFIAGGCASGGHHHSAQGRHARAELNPTANNVVRGTVDFYETKHGIKVVAHVTGLTPGLHGFHIHEKGDCSAPDAMSAGGHFNPGGMKHGGPGDAMRHAGDFGNITANAAGVAKLEFVDHHLTFDGAASIIGRGVIVHANPDDLTGQPAGNAGPRVACGVIQLH
jgi:superoxide dismutase, Cu-Zn family